MSVLIKGMEMPKDGAKLYMIVFSDGKACASYKPFEWHEVVSLPLHGRCIDADALTISTAVPLNGKPYQYVHIDNIKGAPTIIPAEEGE